MNASGHSQSAARHQRWQSSGLKGRNRSAQYRGATDKLTRPISHARIRRSLSRDRFQAKRLSNPREVCRSHHIRCSLSAIVRAVPGSKSWTTAIVGQSRKNDITQRVEKALSTNRHLLKIALATPLKRAERSAALSDGVQGIGSPAWAKHFARGPRPQQSPRCDPLKPEFVSDSLAKRRKVGGTYL